MFGDLASILVAFGAGVVVPIGLIATSRDPSSPDADVARTYDISSYAAAMGAPFAVASYVGARGTTAAALAFVWFLATLAIAACGALRMFRRRGPPLEEIAVDVGHIYLPVGAAWLFASRAAMEPLGFREPVVTFTASHFHYAGFAAPVGIGLLGRELPKAGLLRLLFRYAAPVVLASIPLTAVGITLTHALETPSAMLLGSGMLVASFLIAMVGARRLGSNSASPGRITGVMLLTASASLVLSMSFAVAFTLTGSASRGATDPVIPFATMVQLHGVANALGFALMLLSGFAIVPAGSNRELVAASGSRADS